MRISTKGHYAVQAMVDLALSGGENPVSLSVIAERQELSQNYLEQLFVKLRKANLVNSVRGPGGGYMLSRSAASITIAEIFDAVEESLVLTECVDETGALHAACSKSSGCKTQTLWSQLGQHFNELVRSVSLQNVIDGDYDFSQAVARKPMLSPAFVRI